MEIAVVCQPGATERNREFIHALFRDVNPLPRLFLVGALKPSGKKPAEPGQRQDGLLDQMAATVNSLFAQGAPLHKGKAAWKPEAVIVLWDTDCRDPKALKRDICTAVPKEHRSKVFAYFAHPEPEIWLLADFGNAFSGYSEKNAKAIKDRLAKRVSFTNLEAGLHFDKTRKTCQNKISDVIKSAVKDVTGHKFSKSRDTPRLLQAVDWQAVAGALPTFKPLYDEWLSETPPANRLGACA